MSFRGQNYIEELVKKFCNESEEPTLTIVLMVMKEDALFTVAAFIKH